jgi:hypothetical protein
MDAATFCGTGALGVRAADFLVEHLDGNGIARLDEADLQNVNGAPLDAQQMVRARAPRRRWRAAGVQRGRGARAALDFSGNAGGAHRGVGAGAAGARLWRARGARGRAFGAGRVSAAAWVRRATARRRAGRARAAAARGGAHHAQF